MRPNSKLWVSLGTFLDLWDGLWESQPPEGVWPRNECLHIFHWLPVFPNHPVARQGHMTSQWRRGRNDLCPFQLRQWKTQVWLCHLSMAWSKGLRRPPSSSNDAAYRWRSFFQPGSLGGFVEESIHSSSPIPNSLWTFNEQTAAFFQVINECYI